MHAASFYLTTLGHAGLVSDQDHIKDVVKYILACAVFFLNAVFESFDD